ncbi:MAG: S1C family serine protease [Phycisphaerales bacterium]
MRCRSILSPDRARALTAMVLIAGVGAASAFAEPTDEQGSLTIDTITTLSGKTIMAPILKETAEKVWLDMGFDVLVVPRSDIRSILRADRDTAESDERDLSSLFFTAREGTMPESSPRELAKSIGAAVIKVSTPSGLGSGFIIHPEGYAITNAHVIQGEQRLQATVYEQGEREFQRTTIDNVEIIAVNNHIDLALIKLTREDDRPFRFVYIQGAEQLSAGEEVFAIGNPLGLERSLSTGVIATTQRNFEGLTFIQTTAQINPGNSGGPLFNLYGEVIGCTNMGIPSGEGLGFAIPARYIKDFVRNNDAFSYDRNNPNSGYNYLAAPPRVQFGRPSVLDDASGSD